MNVSEELTSIYNDTAAVAASLSSLGSLLQGDDEIKAADRPGLAHLLENTSKELLEIFSRIEDVQLASKKGAPARDYSGRRSGLGDKPGVQP